LANLLDDAIATCNPDDSADQVATAISDVLPDGDVSFGDCREGEE